MDTPAIGQTVEQGWETSVLEDCCSAEFGSIPNQTHLEFLSNLEDLDFSGVLCKSGPPEPALHVPAVEHNCSSDNVVGLIPKKMYGML